MKTPPRDDDDLRCAEYVLGLLGSSERRALEQLAGSDPSIRSRLDYWQERFAPLADDITPQVPPASVWRRIENDIAPEKPASPAASQAWWDNIRLWRWLGLGAGLTAAMLVVLVLNVQHGTISNGANVAAQKGYLVATIARQDGVAHWTATIDSTERRLVIVPADKPSIDNAKATELWLIPPGEKPIPLGVFDANRPATIVLSADSATRISNKAVLAVSLEPPGGSPTGQPTGPVVATGAINPA